MTNDRELEEALERVRAVTGTEEAEATLVRRLAVSGAQEQLEASRERRRAAEALLAVMDAERPDIDLAAIDELNAAPRSGP